MSAEDSTEIDRLDDQPGADGIPRRTLLHAAWAAPVVALAVGTPAAASSLAPLVTLGASLVATTIFFVVRTATGDNEPIPGTFVILQTRQQPIDPWTGMGSGGTDENGEWTTTANAGDYQITSEFRTIAYIDGTPYPSVPQPMPT